MDPRYSRQVLFPPIGEKGQQRIRASRVTLIGCGALGSSIAVLLARAGVGTLRIADRDFVELDNLQRQALFDEADAAAHLPKAAAAKEKLAKINSAVAVEGHVTDVSHANIESLIEGADLVLDGTDNFETRFLVNDACVRSGRPWVYGGCVGSEGMAMAIRPGETACYACMLPEPPAPGSAPTCDTAGILNTVAGIVAGLQVTEGLKILTGAVEALHPGLVTVDVWANRYRTLAVARQADCRACGRREFPFLEARQKGAATSLCGRNAVQVLPASPRKVDLAEMERKLSAVGKASRNPFLVRAEVEKYELTLFLDGRAIVRGTSDASEARGVYSKFVGT